MGTVLVSGLRNRTQAQEPSPYLKRTWGTPHALRENRFLPENHATDKYL